MITSEKKSLQSRTHVDIQLADTVIRTYKQERWVHNSERIGKEDSLTVWSSLTDLEELIETGKKHGADGIKMYFAAYPENFTERPELAGRQTLVVVATKSKKTEAGVVNKDIYIEKGGATSILGLGGLPLPCPPCCSLMKTGESELGQLGATLIDRGEKGISLI
jgi:hypothetical protein